MATSWDPALSVGNTLIDGQHKELFARLDNLLDALRANQGKEKTGEILQFLGDYVVEHFGAEESLMRRCGYPSAAAHLAQHKAFLESLQALVADFRAKGPSASLALKVTSQVGDWLRNHLRRTDAALASFVRQQSGPQPGAR